MILQHLERLLIYYLGHDFHSILSVCFLDRYTQTQLLHVCFFGTDTRRHIAQLLYNLEYDFTTFGTSTFWLDTRQLNYYTSAFVRQIHGRLNYYVF